MSTSLTPPRCHPQLAPRSGAKSSLPAALPGAEGNTPLLAAAAGGMQVGVSVLLQAKANIEAVNRAGFTALLMAASKGHAGCVELLLGAGAKVGTATQDGFTALHYSAQHRNGPCVEALLERGANVHADANDGQTALYVAAAFGDPECCGLLLRAGADPNQSGLCHMRRMRTPLRAAEERGNTAVVELLRHPPDFALCRSRQRLAFARATHDRAATVDGDGDVCWLVGAMLPLPSCSVAKATQRQHLAPRATGRAAVSVHSNCSAARTQQQGCAWQASHE